MPYKKDYDKKEPPKTQGVVLSFDFVIKNLKLYYSEKSPQGAYAVMERFLKKNGFEKRKDSDYIHGTINRYTALDIIGGFAEANPWFPYCVSKLNISPNIPILDVSADIYAVYANENWKKQKDKENLTSNKSAESSKGKDVLGFVNSHNADKNEINNENPNRSKSNDKER